MERKPKTPTTLRPVILCPGRSTKSGVPAFLSDDSTQGNDLLDLLELLRRVPGTRAPLVVAAQSHADLIRYKLNRAGLETVGIITLPHDRGSAPAAALAAFVVRAHRPDDVVLVLSTNFRPQSGGEIIQSIDAARPGGLGNNIICLDPDSAASGLIFSPQTYLAALRETDRGTFNACVRAYKQGRSENGFFHPAAEAFSDCRGISIREVVDKCNGTAKSERNSNAGRTTGMTSPNTLKVECENVTVIGDQRPIAVVGLSDLIVMDGEDGLVVAAKVRIGDVGEIARRLLQKRKHSERRSSGYASKMHRHDPDNDPAADGESSNVVPFLAPCAD